MVSLRLVVAIVCVGVADLSFGASAAVAKPVTVSGALLSYDKGSNILSFQVYPDTLKMKFMPGVTAVTGPDGAKVDIDHAVNQSDELVYDPVTMKAINLHCMEQ